MDWDKDSELLYAVENGCLEEGRKKISEGTSVKAHGISTDTSVLMIACEKGNIAIVEYLLQNGADIEKRDETEPHCFFCDTERTVRN